MNFKAHHPVQRQALCLLLAMVCALPRAMAQDDAHIVYKLQPRDTLLSLVSQYMQGPDALQQIVKINGFKNANVIPVGYSLKIPRHLIKFTPSTATVNRINCRTITRIEGETAVAVQTGDALQEGHVLRIPPGCQMAIALDDGSTLRMMSGAIIKFKTLRRNMLEHSPEVRLELLDGRMEVDVPRKRLPGDAPFEVRTPTSVAGVRGTEFRVAFDARKRNSQVEVVQGVVSAQGQADKQDQRANAGQGVPIQADGKALPVEDFLDAPRYVTGKPVPGEANWVLQFSAPQQARQWLVRQSEDASFAFFHGEEFLAQAQLTLKDLGPKAVFQQWSSVSSNGIVGHSTNYGFCKAYMRKDVWRCNIHFNLTGLQKPHLRVQKLEATGQVISILDRAVELSANDQLVLRGLPGGQYKWQLDYELGASRRSSQAGAFELVAVPSEP